MTMTTSANGTLSQDIVARILVDPLQQESKFLSLGIPLFVSDGNPVRLPSLTSIGTATGFVAEGAEIGEASVATSEIVLLESSVWSIKDIVKMTREAVETSAINLESAMAGAITGRIAQLVDNALFNGGTATTGSPIGVFNMAGVSSAGTTAGTSLVSSDLFEMQEDYYTNYGVEASALWMMSPQTHKFVRLMSDNYGARVLAPSLAAGAPSTILGMTYVVSTHCPNTALILADRNQLAVGRAPASVTILDQAFASADIIGIRVSSRYDVKPLNPAAIIKKVLT